MCKSGQKDGKTCKRRRLSVEARGWIFHHDSYKRFHQPVYECNSREREGATVRRPVPMLFHRLTGPGVVLQHRLSTKSPEVGVEVGEPVN